MSDVTRQGRSAPELTPRSAGGVGSRPERVVRAVRTFSSRGWLLGHVIVIALAVTMILLGRWQLRVSDRKHFDLQNFGYTLQWWAFTAFGLFMWWRVMRDHLRRKLGAEPESPHAPSGDIVLAGGGNEGPRTGPALLATRPTEPGQAPVVYRGYVMPNTSAVPVRSHGDSYSDAYNDHLWQLSLADTAEQTRAARAGRPDGADLPPEPVSRPELEDGDARP